MKNFRKFCFCKNFEAWLRIRNKVKVDSISRCKFKDPILMSKYLRHLIG